jgi:hypothetical protein
MPLRELDAFNDVPFVPSTPFQREYSGKVFDSVQIALMGQVDLGGTSTLSSAGSLGLMPEFTMVQGGHQLCSLEAPELRFFARLTKGDQDEVNPTSAATDTPFHCPSTIDFGRFMPGAAINARSGNNPVVLSGRFGAYTDAGSNQAAPTGGKAGSLRVTTRTVPVVGSTSFVPRWRTIKKSVSEINDAIKESIAVTQGNGLVLAGILLRVNDSSASAGGGLGGAAVDTLVRKISMRVIKNTETRDVFRRANWSDVQRAGAAYLGMDTGAYASLPAGMAYIPMQDVGAPSLRGGLVMKKGETIELEFDTQSDVETRYAAGTTPASGDQVVITLLAYEAISSATGDLASLSSSQGSAAQRGGQKAVKAFNFGV